MKANQILTSINSMAKQVMYEAGKKSPEILMIIGGVSIIGGVILAATATLKVDQALEETKETILKIHETVDNELVEYDEKDSKKDLMVVYLRAGLNMAKLYAPALLFTSAGIICMLSANNILRKRNAALAASYTALVTSFSKYRQRVSDKYGVQAEHDIRFNVVTDKISETIIDAKGKEKTVDTEVKVATLDGFSDFAVAFNKYTSTDWKQNSEYRDMFLNSQEAYVNDLLRINHRLFLNDVYQALGMPITKAGQLCGWIYDKDHPIGDNRIVFTRIEDYYVKMPDGSLEKSVIIDFNCDGAIIDYI